MWHVKRLVVSFHTRDGVLKRSKCSSQPAELDVQHYWCD